MINIPKLIFILGLGCTLSAVILMGERLTDANIKCIKSFKRRAKYYVLPLANIAFGLILIALAIGSKFIL